MVVNDPLSTLNWLVEAGADEAVAEVPVNRLAAKTNPPLEGGSKNPPGFFGEGSGAKGDPSPKFARSRSQISTLPQGEGKTATLVPDDAIGGAMAAAASATSLAELKAALEAFDGCALKRTATNTVFA